MVLLVLGALAADATARRRPPPPDELRDPFGDSRAPCSQGKSWPKLRACLEKDDVRVSVLHELEGAKLVALVTEGSTSTPLRLYVQNGEQWRQASFFSTNNTSSELLSFKQVGEQRYRIDQGTLMQTSAVIGAPGTVKRVWLRRRVTTLCTDTSCRSVITACDAMVEGKAYLSFRGTLHAQGTTVFVVGDKSRAGAQCAPSPSIFRSEPVGDPLE